MRPRTRSTSFPPTLLAACASALAACTATAPPAPLTPNHLAPPPPFALAAPWPNVQLPRSTSTAVAPASALHLALNRDALLVEGLELPIATRPREGRRGFDARYKANGLESDIEIAPLVRALRAATMERGGRHGALLLGLDRDVTYRTFTEVVFSAIQAQYRELWIAVDGSAGERAIAFPLPKSVELRDGRWKTDFTVIIGHDGFYVKGEGTNVGSGCGPNDGRVTVPRTADYDYRSLTACAAKLQREGRTPPGSTAVILTAGPDIALQIVVGAMDALRADGDARLFPDVVFTVLGGSK